MRKRDCIYVTVIALLIGCLLGMLRFGTVPGAGGKLGEIAVLIQQCFIGEADPEAMEDAAAAAMVAATGDRWSRYMTKEEYALYVQQMKNAVVGVGVTVQAREDNQGLDVISVVSGGPAHMAGIQPGDVLVGVDGQDARDRELSEVAQWIRGKEGTEVKLTVLRDGQETVYSVCRKSIPTPVVEGKLINGNLGLVRIVNFDDRCAAEGSAAVEQLIADGARALIFDVRNNPGGYRHELVKLLDYLLPEGILFQSVDYSGKEETDRSDANCVALPMAVLVNADSYSAAEFFAAALREYEWATVVGQQTSGKGYFQVVYQLTDGSAVGLSIGKYVTPKGVSLEGVGITPDHVVEVDQKTASAIYSGKLDPMEDPQILAAIEALKGK